MSKYISRRATLKGLGTVIALPFLESLMLPRSARAATFNPRFVAMTFPNGIHHQHLWTDNTNSWADERPSVAWTPAEYLANHQAVLNNGAFTLPPIMKGVLDGVRADLTIMGGIKNSSFFDGNHGFGAHPHTSSTWLTNSIIARETGKNYSISMDQYLANAWKDTRSVQISNEPWNYGENAPTDRYCGHISYISDTVAKEKIVHPGALFLALYGDATPTAAPAIDYTAKQKKSILDYVLEQEQGLKRFMSTKDKIIMDQYFTAVRDAELRVPAAPPMTCNIPSRAFGERTDYVTDYKNNPGMYRPFGYVNNVNLTMDLLVLAFQCNITRVATYLFGTDASSSSQFRDEAIIPGFKEDHHTFYSHNGDDAMLTAINRWYLSQFAIFINKLKAVPEGGGTLFDNTLIHFGAGYGDGGKHAAHQIPCILAGKAAGAITSNRYIYAGGYSGGSSYSQREVAEVNLTLLRRLGVNASGWGVKKSDGQPWTNELTVI